MNSDKAHRRAEALFKKEQQSREARQAMADYQAGLHAMREKTARLGALRLARDAANQRSSAEPNTTRRARVSHSRARARDGNVSPAPSSR